MKCTEISAWVYCEHTQREVVISLRMISIVFKLWSNQTGQANLLTGKFVLASKQSHTRISQTETQQAHNKESVYC